jgi:hypothetical protein
MTTLIRIRSEEVEGALTVQPAHMHLRQNVLPQGHQNRLAIHLIKINLFIEKHVTQLNLYGPTLHT